jgi:hypothetical protein
MTAEYRITTNGHAFRIEQKGRTFWKGNIKWTPLMMSGCDVRAYVREYTSLEKAKESLKDIIKTEGRHFDEWKPVEL